MAESSVIAEPYSFEPPSSLLESLEDEENKDSISSDSMDESGDPDPVAKTDPSNWCKCGKRVIWEGQKRRERVCCTSYSHILSKFECEETSTQCITTHQGFRDNCLSKYTIESVIVLLKHSAKRRWKEEFENKAEPHRTFRHVAYCNFVRWVWHTTGRKNRKILPACVVAAVRDCFPSQAYTGFKYAV